MQKACLVFDVLRHVLNVTVFDQKLNVLFHSSTPKQLITSKNEGRVEDLNSIKEWIDSNVKIHEASEKYEIAAINFTSYVGGIAHLDANNELVLPIWDIDRRFDYTTRTAIEKTLGKNNLKKEDAQITVNSFETAALQLLYFKNTKPELFEKITKSVSIAQYFQAQFTKKYFHDYSIVACHSGAWDFTKKDYLKWIDSEKLNAFKLQIKRSSEFIEVDKLVIGAGMYYKVAETIPFLKAIKERFVLLSTGAWTICINPFNHTKATENDLANNCFNVLNQDGKRIKMARLFSGNEHTRQIEHLATHFNVKPKHCLKIDYDANIVRRLRKSTSQVVPDNTELGNMLDSPFMERNLNNFASIEEAYHQFIMDLVAQQVASIKLTIEHRPIIEKIFVEGGLAKNSIFMELLSEAFHDKKVYKVGFEDTAAMGAALVIGEAWGAEKPAEELLELELIE
ncbi:FGGY family carbohydrate kinase [uncultured Arcticibacterium sp.]|uniref:FGGY family carbohydrate kinase n=1 Tax=uncultured Arcticibacterium sp. TaxID=2173042 RepID=UPI0030FC6E1C